MLSANKMSYREKSIVSTLDMKWNNYELCDQ